MNVLEEFDRFYAKALGETPVNHAEATTLYWNLHSYLKSDERHVISTLRSFDDDEGRAELKAALDIVRQRLVERISASS